MTNADPPIDPTRAPTPETALAARAGGSRAVRWRSAVREGVSWRILVTSLALGVTLSGLLTAAAWSVLGRGPVGEPRDVELVIPAGTAAAIEAGGRTTVPSAVTLVEGDRLVIRNEDAVAHAIGGWQVTAGMVLMILADAPTANVFACTIHPSGTLGITIRARPSAAEGILVALAAGIPVGLLVAAGWAAARRIEADADDGAARVDADGPRG